MSGNLSGTGAGYSYTAATGGNYASTYQYDANGNLKTLTRRNSAGTLLDNFTYHYNANTNQLNYVADPAGSLGDDLDNQSVDNYTYDAIGQLVSDEQEEIEEIVWTVTGKVAEIRRKATSTKPDLFFTYDALGRRIRKEVRPRNGSGWVSIRDWVSTLYTYDGQGNVMAVYELKMRESGSTRTENYYISEINLYGSSRLGMIKDYRHIGGRTYSTSGPGGGAPPAMTYYSWDGVPKETRGDKFFELSNHLGNVLAVVTDRKLPVGDGLGAIAYYQPDVVSYSDYMPFGMQMPNRNGSDDADSYRYGFQGQEKDDEVKGEGNSVNYTFRMHDPRVGRFFAIDPLAIKYPELTPYQFSSNRVVDYVEIEGAEGEPGAERMIRQMTSSRLSNQQGGGTSGRIYQELMEAEGDKTQYAGYAAFAASGFVLFGAKAILGYIIEEVIEELAGFPIIPDPGDVIQNKLRTEILPSPSKNRVLTNDPLDIRIQKRSKLAESWMRPNQMKYVDFNKPVYTKTIEEGTDLIQFRVKGTEGTLGNYYAPVGTKPAQIGLDPNDVVQTLSVTVEKNTKVLVSNHTKNATYYANEAVTVEGGGMQFFSRDLKNNVSTLNSPPNQ